MRTIRGPAVFPAQFAADTPPALHDNPAAWQHRAVAQLLLAAQALRNPGLAALARRWRPILDAFHDFAASGVNQAANRRVPGLG